MRVKRRDSEEWMHHRMLPSKLREHVRRYDQYKWLETRGVDEEGLVQKSEPSKASSRTVKALNEVKAFALNADELKFVPSQFRSLHSQGRFSTRFGSTHNNGEHGWLASFKPRGGAMKLIESNSLVGEVCMRCVISTYVERLNVVVTDVTTDSVASTKIVAYLLIFEGPAFSSGLARPPLVQGILDQGPFFVPLPVVILGKTDLGGVLVIRSTLNFVTGVAMGNLAFLSWVEKGQKIDKSMEEIIEDSFGGELDGKERASMEWKKNMDDKHDSLLNINGRGCFPFDAKQTCQPMPSNIIGNYVHGNMTSDSVSLQKSSDSLANEAANKLKLGFISTRPVPPQFDNLFVTDSEEDYLDGHNSDSAGSTRYFFQTKDIENNSTASKSTGTDCTILKEGNLDSSDDPLECQKPSGSLKGSMDTVLKYDINIPLSCNHKNKEDDWISNFTLAKGILTRLKELKENCKRDLEKISLVPSEK
ncbi:hypothetical protein ZIOFF_043737 [Zingiber officinale]|uniref:Uncharacterized protein n=1 Tax=Zingiber officinale TaxID=94328 RepID=A0A8J5FX57_ZINOF|nr:hypothetical protein ZIOFF_043737 [Zingiber officinale]